MQRREKMEEKSICKWLLRLIFFVIIGLMGMIVAAFLYKKDSGILEIIMIPGFMVIITMLVSVSIETEDRLIDFIDRKEQERSDSDLLEDKFPAAKDVMEQYAAGFEQRQWEHLLYSIQAEAGKNRTGTAEVNVTEKNIAKLLEKEYDVEEWYKESDEWVYKISWGKTASGKYIKNEEE
jgi:hypothetical protein